MTAAHLLAAGQANSGGSPAAFWVLAVISVAAGLGMILARQAVYCAVLLAVVMLSLAVLYAEASAPFLAFVQIIVYTGAVLMLFLFVLMIVGVSAADSTKETIHGQRGAAAVAGIGLLVLLALIIGHAAIGPAPAAGASYSSTNVPAIAALIFTKYVFPFEVTAALLITAALGAMVLAYRERTGPRPTQRDLSRERVAGGHPAPLPGPGVFARHNAADFPALLPDGSPSELSVSPIIAHPEGGRVPPAQLPAGLGADTGQGNPEGGSGHGASARAAGPAAPTGPGAAPGGAAPEHEEARP